MSLGVRASCLFAALFIIYGVQVTYLSVWLDWRGLSAPEIGLVAAAPLFMRIVVTPSVAFLADRNDAHRGAVIALGSIALGALVLLGQVDGFWPVLALVVIAAVTAQTILPLTDTIAMKAVLAQQLDYGRMRLWGSLTFVAASFLAGFAVEATSPAAVIWLLGAGAAATVAAAYLLPERRADRADAEAVTRPALRLADVAAFVRQGRFVLFVIASGAIQASHAMFYAFGVLHWRGQALTAGAVGTLWAIGVLAEIVLFSFSRQLIERFGAGELVLAGAGAGILRWALMALDPPFAALAALQMLHAATFAATHLGAVHWIGQHMPQPQQATAQALLATLTSVAMGGAVLLSGALYARLGGISYLAMCAIAGLGLIAGLTVRTASGPR